MIKHLFNIHKVDTVFTDINLVFRFVPFKLHALARIDICTYIIDLLFHNHTTIVTYFLFY
jgi:hypothetical protein